MRTMLLVGLDGSITPTGRAVDRSFPRQWTVATVESPLHRVMESPPSLAAEYLRTKSYRFVAEVGPYAIYEERG